MISKNYTRKPDKSFFDNLYSDPFQSPRANPKHSKAQINGETQQSQHEIILSKQMKKRT
ncbi:hypothetical protein N781_14345 [Pontibacillus halophilus JSM 076056 = DSM 19796]|uniref:YpzG family protein n=1 Tax=Pontibacillus halophilus JSM 076056 = DSM 19796 TaxID=1385510 RepID=A0A0A5G8B3_9BACI|nr:YpzG family protein [Pontibacillus halophilus]KGX87413.1 hypothetical protein N781_14345 [Pontibacillus halophilus JSM 076056 = DSM 19796]